MMCCAGKNIQKISPLYVNRLLNSALLFNLFLQNKELERILEAMLSHAFPSFLPTVLWHALIQKGKGYPLGTENFYL